jgi:ABC-2 type transport system ATP-binding protein
MSAIPERAIVVENIHKSYGSVQALKGVDLVAQAGKVLGLLGPNGAGKTTLVRILTTLLLPDSGVATVGGIDVLKYPERVRHIIGLAGQYPAVDELLTGRENLEMVAQLYHFSRADARNRARELLTQFDLTDAANRMVKTYSGGMRRRLDLAASLVTRPPILLLDEPTTGLDPRTRRGMWDAIRELVKDGATLLLTTQYLEEADVLADRIAVVDHGRIIAEGTSDELKALLGQDVLEIRISDASLTPRAAALLEQAIQAEPQIDAERGLLTASTSGAQSLIAAVRALDDAGIAVADVALRRPSLDEVFLSITGQPESEREHRHTA